MPLIIRSKSSQHKQLFKLSQWYAQTTTYWFIRYHAFTQESGRGVGGGGGSDTLILTPLLIGSAQKYVQPPLEWGEIKTIVYVWRQIKPNVAASKNGRKRGNKTEFCYHWVQFLAKCWSTFFTVVLKITVFPLHTYMYMIYRELCPHFLSKFLVNGEILSTWWIYIRSFTAAASQIIGKYGEL